MTKQNGHKGNADVFGMAISAFYTHGDTTPITVHSPDFDDDIIPIEHLFRNFDEMPALEKRALNECFGKVLDVGCGAGSHSLYLQRKNKEVFAIDLSRGAINTCKSRGVKQARVFDFFELANEKFDTILMLMNGSGIIGKLENLNHFFMQARKLLHKKGQILMDSSDLSYLFETDDDGDFWVNPEEPYYGELEFSLSYKGVVSNPFSWLYLDYGTLHQAATSNNFSCIKLEDAENQAYLACLKPG